MGPRSRWRSGRPRCAAPEDLRGPGPERILPGLLRGSGAPQRSRVPGGIFRKPGHGRSGRRHCPQGRYITDIEERLGSDLPGFFVRRRRPWSNAPVRCRKIGWAGIILALDSTQIKEGSPRGIRRLAALRAFLCVCRGWGISRDGLAGKCILGGRERGQRVEVQ